MPITHAVLCLQLLAFWPVWRWYLARMSDASDEPLGIVALATVVLVLLLHARPRPLRPWQVCTATLLTGLYLGAWAWCPPLVRGSLAILALGYTLGAGYWHTTFHPGLLGLLWLSLPVSASLQFYAGYPLRVGTAWLAAQFISLTGFAVTAQGTALLWQGEVIAVDAPCAGIRMLWVGMYLSCTLSCMTRLRAGATGMAAGLALGVLFLGNVGRNVLLFYGESGIVQLASWMHTGIGLVVFSGVALAIVGCHRLIKHGRTVPVQEQRGEDGAPHGLRLSPATLAPLVRPVFGLCVLVHALTVVLPFFTVPVAESLPQDTALLWPTQLAGRPLLPLPLSAQEQAFLQGFPGQVGRFTDGSREIVIRWVQRASRSLHPASDCFQGLGYTVQPQPLRVDHEGAYWGCFQASRSDQRLQVCERIVDSQGQGWSDVSTWYWAALFGKSTGPWWAFTVAESAAYGN